MSRDGICPAIIGPFGPAQLACLRSWTLHSDPIFVHLTGRPLPGWLRPCRRYMAMSLETLNTAEGQQRLARFLNESKCTGIVCVAERLAMTLHGFAELLRCPLLLPSTAAISSLASKWEQVQLAKRSGFALLQTHRIRDFRDIPTSDYPYAVRPVGGMTSRQPFKVELVKRREDFVTLAQSAFESSSELLAQPFRAVPNIVIHVSRRPDGDLRLAAFLVFCKFEGVTLAITRTEIPPHIASCCRRFLEALDYVGVGHFELLDEAPERAWFLEFNGRLGGTTAKVQRLGWDEPNELLHAFGILPLRNGGTVARAAYSLRALVRHAAVVLRGVGSPFDYPNSGRLETLARAFFGIFRWREETWSWRSPLLTIRFQVANLLYE